MTLAIIYPATAATGHVANEVAIRNRRITRITVNASPTAIGIPPRNSKSPYYGTWPLVAMEVESTVEIGYCSITVDNAIVRAILGTYCDGFAMKIDVAVAGACICARIDYDDIAMARIVYSRLNVIETRRPIIIDRDSSPASYGYHP